MLPDGGGDDEERWLAEGIAGVQQNAFYMHRALVLAYLLRSEIWDARLEQPQGRAQVLGADAPRAAHLAPLPAQVLRALHEGV